MTLSSRLTSLVGASALAFSLAGSAAPALAAEAVAPVHAAAIDLGSTRGTVYYTEAADGFHVVATLQSGSASTPMRFQAVLSKGQSATVSIPGPAGTNPASVIFTHSNDRLIVRDPAEELPNLHNQKHAVTTNTLHSMGKELFVCGDFRRWRGLCRGSRRIAERRQQG